MAHGQNANKRLGRELWGARPCSYMSQTAENKRICRRMERAARRRVEYKAKQGEEV